MRAAITALLLDLDDTLVDTRAAMVAAGTAAAAQLWPEADAGVHQAVGLHFHGDPSGFFGRFTTGELAFEEMRESRISDLLEVFSLKATDDVHRRFEEFYGPAFFASLALFDDVLTFLEDATASGMHMGLLTNSSSRYTQQKLELTGLLDVFPVVVTRDTLGFGKPDARAFHHACGLLGVTPGQTAYVGDHLEIDAIAAKDAGLYAVWLQRDPGGSECAILAQARGIRTVSSLKEVAASLVGD